MRNIFLYRDSRSNQPDDVGAVICDAVVDRDHRRHVDPAREQNQQLLDIHTVQPNRTDFPIYQYVFDPVEISSNEGCLLANWSILREDRH